MKHHVLSRSLVSVLAGGCLIWAVSAPSNAAPDGGHGNGHKFAYAPNQIVEGNSQAVWAKKFTRWLMERPIAGHPAIDGPGFDVSAGQNGDVWFLAAPFATGPNQTIVRSIDVPEDKSLFVMLVGGEWSDLEGGAPTEQEQRDLAVWQADHILPASLSCQLDGQTLANPINYRQESPQFSFNAPTPWIFGETGGAGKSVAAGYYVLLKQLDPGQHTLHYTGQFHFTLEDDGFDFDGYINMTYNITQEAEGCGGHGH